MNRSYRRVARSFVLCAGMVAVAGLSAADAGLIPTGSISGRVTDKDGSPIANVCVAPFRGNSATVRRTDVFGNYSATGLADGAYRVWFDDSELCRDRREYASEWYDDHVDFADADEVVVSGGQAVTGVDAVLDKGGIIRGTVTTAEGPLQGACVWVYGASQSPDFDFQRTDAQGNYEARPLHTDSYTVVFEDCGVSSFPRTQCSNRNGYAYEFYDDKDSFEDATPVTVAVEGVVTGIDAFLEPALPSDLRVAAVTVTPVEGSGDQTLRNVVVTADNDGGGESENAGLEVLACGATIGCTRIGDLRSLSLDPGESTTEAFSWNTDDTRSLGDVTIVARVGATNDADCSNNESTASSFARIPDSGVGVSVGTSLR